MIYKQGKWRNILLLSFYFFSFTAIFFRLIFQVFFYDAYFDKTSWVMFCGTISPYAKLCVGLLQCYMVFELAQRLKPAYVKNTQIKHMSQDVEQAVLQRKRRKYVMGQKVVAVTTLVLFFIANAAAIYSMK